MNLKDGDGANLLRAVCAAPDDNAPRLVFADWLDENGGQVWAEYIRLSVKIESRTQKSSHKERMRKQAMEGQHQSQAWGGWKRKGVRLPRPGITVAPPDAPPRWDYTHAYMQAIRGFLGGVNARMTWWLKYGPKLVQHHPIEVLNIAGMDPSFSTEFDSTAHIGWFVVTDASWTVDILNDYPPEADDVPERIGRYLNKGKKSTSSPAVDFLRIEPNLGWYYYDTVEQATDDLNHAALTFCRKEGGIL